MTTMMAATTMLITTSNSLLKDIAEVPSNGTISNYSIKCSKISDGENNSDITVSSTCVDNAAAAAAHSYYDSGNDNDSETVNDNDYDEQEKEAEDETTADGSITDNSILMLMSKAKGTNYGNIVLCDGVKKGSYRSLFPWLLLKSRRQAPLSPLSSKKGKGRNDEYWRRSIQGPMREGSVMEMVFYNVQNAP
ncbi:hypothetical protein FRACYDRAFT_271426 [Fragilariopsis cylindrus CCMP1102]|uniref:Uncharacterized protein n=1 Tax=Fragilariopsis cylindrus CCMP1102 TaxID=635003 RepID=A0A1E7ETQ2_9STRA|nr:hypothetical protein FRACYDRAFT_271426 [Fragilariopsis cylindrus CCMP1102]|eukprot:OEU09226.1 hypothetical protein FRACYDRAFT_271426 [Fragilariopsis cylindrus CCMP1102]